jgi:hypothetical protein
MNTDKELLELAAKAAGLNVKMYEFDQDDNFKGLIVGRRGTKEKTLWNPLVSDGDALRLAVILNLTVCTGPCQASATSISGALSGFFPKEDTIEQNAFAATRKAIVRAAAHVGQMQ